MPIPFRPGRRRALLDEAFRLMPLALEDVEAGERLAALCRSYEERLPRQDLSRCPITGWVQKHTFDPFGLDGLWWNCHAPARPLRERIPTCLALTGAVRIEAPVECFPFLAKPGPGAPFVIPRLLELPGVQAVIRSLSCGRHEAFCIAYFAPDEIHGVECPTTGAPTCAGRKGGYSRRLDGGPRFRAGVGL